MTTILMLFTLYALASPAVEEPLHGYISEHGEQATSITYATTPPSYDQIKPQQTPLVGHVIEDKGVHGNLYLVNKKGLVFWRVSHHPDTAFLKRGDRILAIDGHKFNLNLWHNLMCDFMYHLTVEHKDKTIEDIPWMKMTPLEYEQNR